MKSTEKVIITCDNCLTKYKVPKSRFSGKVKKVKCVKCHHVFLPSLEQSTPLSASTGENTRVGNDSLFLRKEAPKKTTQQEDPFALTVDAEKAYLESISLDDDLQKESPSLQPLKDSQRYKVFLNPNEEETLRNTPSSPSTSESELRTSGNPQVDVNLEKKLKLSQISKTTSNWSDQNVADDEDAQEEEDLPPQENSFAFTEIPSSLTTQHQTLPIVEEVQEEPSRAWGQITAVIFGLLFAFLVVTGSGTYFGLIDVSFWQAFGLPPTHQLQIQTPLQAKQIKNALSGKTLFVVNTNILNEFDTDKEAQKIQLKGLAFDPNQNIVEASVSYAGSVLSDEDLATWSIDKLKTFYREDGATQETPFRKGEVIPFQIVFFETGTTLATTSVQIVSYRTKDELVYVRLDRN